MLLVQWSWISGEGADSATPVVATGHKDSIYSLATNNQGTIVASGSVENVIRLWDPRAGKKQFKLKGHTDVVRGLVLHEQAAAAGRVSQLDVRRTSRRGGQWQAASGGPRGSAGDRGRSGGAGPFCRSR